MKADTDSAVAELLREIKEENPGASEEELCRAVPSSGQV